MPHKTLLIVVLCTVAIQQQFLVVLAREQKSAAEPIKLADISYGPYRADVTPISNLEKSDNPREFATKLKLIIAQSDFEKNYGSYGKKTMVICNLDKSDDPQVFENELNKIVAQSDFKKHVVDNNASESKNPAVKLQNVSPLGSVSSDNESDVKSHPTKYLTPQ